MKFIVTLLALGVFILSLCSTALGAGQTLQQYKATISKNRVGGKRISLMQGASNSAPPANATVSIPPKVETSNTTTSIKNGTAPIEPTKTFMKAEPQIDEKEGDSFLYKMSVGLFFVCLPCAIFFSFKHVWKDTVDRRNAIIQNSRGGHQFTKLSASEEEAEEMQSLDANKRLHTAADDWDEFLGDRKVGSAYSGAPSRYVAFSSSGSRTPPNGDEEVEEV